MAVYDNWSLTYGVAEEGNFGTGRDAETGLPLTNTPNFDPGVNIIDQKMAVGTSYRKTLEYMVGNKNPTVSLEMLARADDITLLLNTLFQRVWEHDATVFSKVFLPYNFAPSFKNQGIALATGADGVTNGGAKTFSSDTIGTIYTVKVGDWIDITSGDDLGLYRITSISSGTYTLDANAVFLGSTGASFAIYRGYPSFLSLIKNTQVSTESHQLISCIANSIKFGTASGAPVTFTADILAKSLDTADAAQTGDTFTLYTDAFLLSQDMRCLFAAPDTSTASLQAYDTTVATTNQTTIRVAGDLTSEYAIGNYVTLAEGQIAGTNNILNITEFSWDYVIYSSVMLIDQNDDIDFREDSGEGLGSELTATIPAGRYNAQDLAVAVQTALIAAGDNNYTCTYNISTRNFTIANSTLISFSLLWQTGTYQATNAADVLGFDRIDDTGVNTYTSDTATGTINDVEVTIPSGTYLGEELALEVNNQLNHNSSLDGHYDVAFHPGSKKFTIATTNDYEFTIDVTASNTITAVLGWIVNTSPLTVDKIMTSATTSSMFKNVNAYKITNVIYDGVNTILTVAMDADVTTDAGNRVYAWREVKLESMDITFTNNATAHNYNSQTVLEYVFGDFQATGTLTLPFGMWSSNVNLDIENFTNGYDMPMIFTWGHDGTAYPATLRLWGTTDGDLCIRLTARYTGAPLSGDVEIMQELPFEAVTKNLATNFAVPMIIVGDGTTARNWKLCRDGSNDPN